MAKCTQDWDECSGFFGCIIPAITTAAKCSASYLADNYTKEMNKTRTLCYETLQCAWKAYLSGGITADEYLNALDLRAASYSGAFKVPEIKKLFPERMLFGAKPTKAMISIHEQALHLCGQLSDDAPLLSGIAVNTPVINKLVYSQADFNRKLAYSKGLCAKYSGDDVLNASKEVLKNYFEVVATLEGGAAKKGYDAIKSLAAGTPSGVAMESLFSVLQDYGIEVPQEVKTFLTCLYSKAGALVFTAVKQAVLDGDPKGAGQLLAPYAIDCGAKTLKEQLGAGSPWAPLVDAIVLAAIVATAPPPPPKPKVPVTDPKVECKKTGGIYFETTGQCFPFELAFSASKSAEKAVGYATTMTIKQFEKEKEKKLEEQRQQQQLMLLAGVAVVAYLALS